MFSKAKRFQNEIPDTPGVGAYDVQLMDKKRNCHFAKSERFNTHGAGSIPSSSSFRDAYQLNRSVGDSKQMTTEIDMFNDESVESASEVSNQHVLSCPEDEVISQLKCDMKSLQQQLQEATEARAALEVKLSDVVKEKDDLLNTNEENYQALHSMTAKCIEIEEELDQQHKQYRESLSLLKAELQVAQGALAQRNKDYELVKEAYSRLEKQFLLQEVNQRTLTADMAQMKVNMQNIESNLEEAASKISLKDDEIFKFKDQVMSLEQMIECRRGEIQAMNDTLCERELLLATLREEIESLTSTKKTNDDAEEVRQTDVAKLKLELKDLQAELALWRDRYHEIEDKYRPYQIQIDALMDANSGLKDQTELALSEATKFSLQYAQLVGHQNKKQRIHHVEKLTRENIALKREIMRLREDAVKVKRTARKAAGKTAGKTTGMENLSHQKIPLSLHNT